MTRPTPLPSAWVVVAVIRLPAYRLPEDVPPPLNPAYEGAWA